MRRVSPWLAGILFAAFLGLGYLYFYRAAQMALKTADWEAGRKEGDKRLASLKQQLDAAQAAEGEAAKHLADAAKAPAPAKQAPQERKTLHIADMVRDHPELAAIRERDARRNMLRWYGPALDTLNLPPETLAKLKDLLVQQMAASGDATAAARAQGLKPGTPEWRQAVQQSTLDIQQQITATLQTAVPMNWAQLQARVGFTDQVQSNFGPELILAGAPLSPAQSQALVQAMADATYAGRDTSGRPANYNVRDPSTGLTPHDLQILNNAAGALTPEQLQAIKTGHQEAAVQAAVYKEYGTQGQPVQFVP